METQIIRKILLSFFATLSIVFTFGQNYTGSFPFRTKVYNVKSEKEESGALKITLEEEENTEDFTMNPMKLETFDIAFKSKLKLMLPESERTYTAEELGFLTTTAKNLFFNIIAESLRENLSEAPVSGKLQISKELDIYESHKDSTPQEKLAEKITITDVQIEFYEGYIETIKVNGTNNVKTFTFENQYGIGFSVRKNYSNFKNVKLYDFQEDKYIYLSDLLDYDYTVKPLTRDYSPGNQVLYSYGGQKVILHKDETERLLEGIIYSDFVGLDNNKPNGLVQMEIAKRWNLHPNRKQTVDWMRWSSSGFGWLQYIRPAITVSKIEENNRFLQPIIKDTIFQSSLGTDSLLESNISVTPIRVLNYQKYMLGLDLNILFLDNPDMKYNIYVNGGFRYGTTAIRDSLRELTGPGTVGNNGLVNEFNIDFFTVYPEVILQFLQEERVGFSISNKCQYFIPAFENPKLVSYDRYNKLNLNTSKWINTFEISLYFKTGPNGRVFGRWRLNSQFGNVTEHYHQVQLGYSFYVLKKN